MNFKTTLMAAALVSAAAFAAQAGTVLTDTFNDGSTSILNWTGDSVFSSPSSYAPYGGGSNASTDYVAASNTYGISCFTGASGCVDLDGSTGTGNDPAGVLQSITSFGPGNYTLSFDLSGNQRGFAAQTTDVYFGSQLVFSSGPLVSGAAFALDSFTFHATSGGDLTFVEVGPSTDAGNILDNVTLTANSVPEPAAWALMLVGFGALGVMLRRRGKAAIA